MKLSERPIALQSATTARFTVYVAGDPAKAREICRQACDDGLCVSVTDCDFIYTGGEERGVAVGLINYPRFPRSSEHLRAQALDLAERLIRGLHQTSATIVGPTETVWLSRRGEA